MNCYPIYNYNMRFYHFYGNELLLDANGNAESIK